MTAYVTLRCEREQPELDGGDIGICPSLVIAPGGVDTAGARAYAAALGWSTDERGRDLCGCHLPRRVLQPEPTDSDNVRPFPS